MARQVEPIYTFNQMLALSLLWSIALFWLPLTLIVWWAIQR